METSVSAPFASPATSETKNHDRSSTDPRHLGCSSSDIASGKYWHRQFAHASDPGDCVAPPPGTPS